MKLIKFWLNLGTRFSVQLMQRILHEQTMPSEVNVDCRSQTSDISKSISGNYFQQGFPLWSLRYPQCPPFIFFYFFSCSILKSRLSFLTNLNSTVDSGGVELAVLRGTNSKGFDSPLGHTFPPFAIIIVINISIIFNIITIERIFSPFLIIPAQFSSNFYF